MSANCKIQLNIIKNNIYNCTPYITNFFASYTTPLQLLFHTYLIFWTSSYSDSIHHFIIIPYLLFITTLFINSPHLFFIVCSLFIIFTDPQPSHIPIVWIKWWILVNYIFLKANTTTQAHLKTLHILLTSNYWFYFWGISPGIIQR